MRSLRPQPYDTDYRRYPPVHDVSVEVKGQAALDARNYASFLWSFGIANQTSWNQSPWFPQQDLDVYQRLGAGYDERDLEPDHFHSRRGYERSV